MLLLILMVIAHLLVLLCLKLSDYSEVSISVNGDINYTFSKNKHHIIPIYGLYADYDNTVILASEDKRNKTINIKTSSLPEKLYLCR